MRDHVHCEIGIAGELFLAHSALKYRFYILCAVLEHVQLEVILPAEFFMADIALARFNDTCVICTFMFAQPVIRDVRFMADVTLVRLVISRVRLHVNIQPGVGRI